MKNCHVHQYEANNTHQWNESLSSKSLFYLCVSLRGDTHASELQPSDFQAQRCNVSASHIQDLILQLASPYQGQHRLLSIAHPVKHSDSFWVIHPTSTDNCCTIGFFWQLLLRANIIQSGYGGKGITQWSANLTMTNLHCSTPKFINMFHFTYITIRLLWLLYQLNIWNKNQIHVQFIQLHPRKIVKVYIFINLLVYKYTKHKFYSIPLLID